MDSRIFHFYEVLHAYIFDKGCKQRKRRSHTIVSHFSPRVRTYAFCRLSGLRTFRPMIAPACALSKLNTLCSRYVQLPLTTFSRHATECAQEGIGGRFFGYGLPPALAESKAFCR